MDTDKKEFLIGYDAKRIVANGTGLGSYGRTLVNALAEASSNLQLRLYAPDEGRDDLRRQITERSNLEFVFSGKSGRIAKDMWRNKGIVKDLLHDGIQLYHGLSGELPGGISKAGIPALVTIHDLIFLRHPEYYNPIDVWLYRRKFKRTLREASRIVAISQCTKRDILAFGNYPEEKIDIVYQGCGTRFKTIVSSEQKIAVRQKYDLPQRYILNVGTIEERKNVLLAIRALPFLPREVHLVIVGRQQKKYLRQIDGYLDRHEGLRERVRFLSGVPNDDLYAIYQQAEVFVYPSRYEGFGIPIIEAIQSGLPVVACSGSCLEEAGGPNSLYVNPDNVEAMADAILTFMMNKECSRDSVAASQQYIRRFENADLASQMLDEYRKLLLCGPDGGVAI